MYPVLFEFGGIAITSFGVFMAAAFLGARWLTSKELKRHGDDPEIAWDLLVYAAIGGLLGAKIWYMVLHWQDTVANPAQAIFSRSGLVWYGGFILATLLVIWRIRKLNLGVGHVLDTTAPGLALGYALGRFGCFLVGDDYGYPTTVPWAIAFPQGAPPSTAENLRNVFGVAVPAEIPGSTVLAVHPTQLYEVGMALIMLAILWRLRTRLTAPGALFAAYLALAGLERFIVEFFRAKDDRFIGALTVSQMVAVASVLIGFATVEWLRRHRSGIQVAAALNR
jgi:phosphatidylglycerol---prolipoprotein diacylglyceryl transferase